MIRTCALCFLALAAAGFILSCNSPSPLSGGQAEVSLYLTDAPLDLAGVSAVNVTLSGVTLYPSDATGEEGGVPMEGGPISLPGDLTLNLLDFQNGHVTFIGSQTVPAGSYNRVRLELVSAEIVRDDDGDPLTPDVTETITLASNKVDVPIPFTVTAGENMEVTIDFDAQASVQVNTTNGNPTYILRPVINVAGMKKS